MVKDWRQRKKDTDKKAKKRVKPARRWRKNMESSMQGFDIGYDDRFIQESRYRKGVRYGSSQLHKSSHTSKKDRKARRNRSNWLQAKPKKQNWVETTRVGKAQPVVDGDDLDEAHFKEDNFQKRQEDIRKLEIVNRNLRDTLIIMIQDSDECIGHFAIDENDDIPYWIDNDASAMAWESSREDNNPCSWDNLDRLSFEELKNKAREIVQVEKDTKKLIGVVSEKRISL